MDLHTSYNRALEQLAYDYPTDTAFNIICELKRTNVESYREIAALYFLQLNKDDQYSHLFECLEGTKHSRDIAALLLDLATMQIGHEYSVGTIDTSNFDDTGSDIEYFLNNELVDGLVFDHFDVFITRDLLFQQDRKELS